MRPDLALYNSRYEHGTNAHQYVIDYEAGMYPVEVHGQFVVYEHNAPIGIFPSEALATSRRYLCTTGRSIVIKIGDEMRQQPQETEAHNTVPFVDYVVTPPSDEVSEYDLKETTFPMGRYVSDGTTRYVIVKETAMRVRCKTMSGDREVILSKTPRRGLLYKGNTFYLLSKSIQVR